MSLLDDVSAKGYKGNMEQWDASLPVELCQHVDAPVRAEGFFDRTDFLRDLIRRDQDEFEADVRRVQALIDEGIASGVIDAEPEDILRAIIAETPGQHG